MAVILFVGADLPDQVAQELATDYVLFCPEVRDVFSLLQTVTADIIMLALKHWHALLWEVVASLPVTPGLVLLQMPGDRLTGHCRLPCWTSPFTSKRFQEILSIPRKPDNYALVILPVQGSYLPVLFDQLQLVRRQMDGQVLVFTQDGDYWVSLQFEDLAVQLPVTRFTCLSNQLIVTRKGLRITKRGLFFRGGYLRIGNR